MDGLNELDEIMNGPETAPVVTTTETTTTETDAQRARDEQGRFATAETADQDAQAAIEGKPEQSHTGTVPQQALHAAREQGKSERDRADRLERELAELRGQVTALTPKAAPTEAPKPTNWYADPDKAVQERLQPIQQEVLTRHMQTSRMLAEDKFGEEAVKAADDALGAAIQANPNDPSVIALAQSVKTSAHPYREMINWHTRQQAMKDIGEDPAAYRSRIEAEARAAVMAEYGIEAPSALPTGQPSNTKPLIKLPQSLSRLPGAGNGSGSADLSDAGIFSEAMAGR